MRRSLLAVAAVLAVSPLAIAACVGDSPDTAQPSGNTPDASTGNTNDANTPGQTDNDSGSSTDTDSGTDAGPVKCGYPGEACCGGGLAPCNQGTVCSANVCMVNDVIVVGDAVNGFQHDGMSATYNGLGWAKGPNLGVENDDLLPYGVYSPSPGQYWAITNSAGQASGNKMMVYTASGTQVWEVCGVFGCPDPGASTSKELWAIFGFGAGDMWVGGTNIMKQCSGTTCTAQTTGLPANWSQGSFSGSSSTDLWYSQYDHAFHYDGTTWTTHSNIVARGFWARNATDAWGGDKAGLQHWDGNAWSSLYAIGGAAPPGTIYGMGGSATDNVWAVGYGTTPFTAHWDGTAWSLVPIDASAGQLSAIWVPSKVEAFAIGFDSGVWHWDGKTWSQMSVPVTASWNAIHGSAKPRP